MSKHSAITQGQLINLLDYDQSTGVFRWKSNGRMHVAGAIAGATSHKGGYRLISLGARGRAYLAHRLAWMYVYGEFPDSELDHIDRNPDNNAIANLRACTRQENAYNTVRNCGETSNYTGVSWDKARGMWVARIRMPSGKRNHIGRFSDEKEAADAYRRAKASIDPFAGRQPGVYGWTQV